MSKDIKIGNNLYRIDLNGTVVLYDTDKKLFNLNTREKCSVEELQNLRDALSLLLNKIEK